MGCCQSNESQDEKARNEEIENQLKRDKINMRNEVKMLLLGKKKKRNSGWPSEVEIVRKFMQTTFSFFFFFFFLPGLGAGESGKSTVLKQMKLIHDGGYTQDEREAFKEIIFSNTIQSMRVILDAMLAMDVSLENEHRPFAAIIMEQPAQIERDFLPPDVTQAIRSLWKDPHLQSVFERSREYQLNDSAK